MMQFGVVCLPAHYAFGLDIRFMCNAAVVIVSDCVPHSEDVRQMVARGNRSLGTFEGYLFYVGN
jgi:ribosomal protein L14